MIHDCHYWEVVQAVLGRRLAGAFVVIALGEWAWRLREHLRPTANWVAVQHQLFGPGLEYMKWYFLVGCPIKIGAGRSALLRPAKASSHSGR
jgi:hypothetical protein